MWTILGLAISVGGYFAAGRVAGFLVAKRRKAGLMETIFGLNALEFVLLTWAGCVVVALACDIGPEIYHEQKDAWVEKHPKKECSEITVEMPVGSFDPETTLTIPKIKKQPQEHVFIISKRPAGRHAKS